MAVVLKCPECEDKFRWEFADEQRWPKACPLCKADMGGDDDDSVICMPALRGAATKAHDALYRQMEHGSEVRAEAAAEKLGVPVSDMANMKMTNMLDGRKPGESYAPELPSNPVTEHMAAVNAQGGQFGFAGSNGVGYSGSVQTGPAPNAGAKMRTALQQQHARATAHMSGGPAVSDRPALETTAAGYRRRG